MHTRYSSDEYRLTNVRGPVGPVVVSSRITLTTTNTLPWNSIVTYFKIDHQSYDINVYTIGQIARLLNQGKLPLKNNELHKQSETQNVSRKGVDDKRLSMSP